MKGGGKNAFSVVDALTGGGLPPINTASTAVSGGPVSAYVSSPFAVGAQARASTEAALPALGGGSSGLLIPALLVGAVVVAIVVSRVRS